VSAKVPPKAPIAAAETPARDSNGRGRMMVVALGLSGFGAALAVYALPLFILLYGGLMPTLVAYITDERRGKHLLITVGAMNGAGVLLAFRPFFANSFSLDSGLAAVSNPSSWLLMYGFAMAGWFIAWLIPQLVSHALDLVYHQKQRATEAAREALAAQWPGMIGITGESDENAPVEAPSAPAAARPRTAVRARG